MLHRAVLCALILVLASVAGRSQQLTPAQQFTISNGAQGKEFWIAIPPNEINPFPTTSLDVYLASPFDTDVFVLDAAGGVERRYRLKANEVRTLSEQNGELSWVMEIREYEQVVRKGIRLRADKPFTVSVLNGKVTSSDGYLALPTAIWDTSYIVTSYYDFREFKSWAGGFTILAAEDGTEVDIHLRGTGALEASTSGGRNIGQRYTITMDAGTVYHVKGDGTTRGVFDLTGTRIRSNKPVGVISSHQRTTMPNLLVNGNGRDHLVEMNLPVSLWDTIYTTVELERNGTNPQARGDVFRVVAAEPDTRWQLTYYNAETGAFLGQGGGVLTAAGDFADLSQSAGPTFLTSGVSIWTADKPIQVVQYSCSSSFDGDQVHDPFQINLLPRDHYVTATTFQIPTDPKFSEHYLNLIFQADPDDPDVEEALKAVTLDGQSIWDHPNAAAPGLLESNIDGTNVFWARIRFGNTAYAHTVLSSDVPFSGYIYGFGAVDSYGWPLGPVHPNLVATDTAKPVVDMRPSMDVIAEITVTEKTNVPEQVRDEPLPGDQVDAGIADVGLLNAANLTLRTVRAPGQRRIEATEAEYEIVAVDPEEDGTATLYVLDYAGNVTYEEIEFIASRYPEIAAPSMVDLGETGVDTAICATDKLIIRNTGNDIARITAMEILSEDSEFSIDTDGCPLPILIGPKDSIALTCVCFVASASGSYGTTLQFTSNDQEEPHTIVLSARVRENVQVSVQEEPEAANGLRVSVSASGEVLLEGGHWQPSTWTLFSLSGDRIGTGFVPDGIDVRLVSTDALPNGLYVLRLDGGGKTSSHKILVAR